MNPESKENNTMSNYGSYGKLLGQMFDDVYGDNLFIDVDKCAMLTCDTLKRYYGKFVNDNTGTSKLITKKYGIYPSTT
jgi:hypothetical protein